MPYAKRKPKPKPAKPVKRWLVGIAGSVGGTMQSIYTFATPDNMKWIADHGGKLFSLVGLVLSFATVVHAFWPPKKP